MAMRNIIITILVLCCLFSNAQRKFLGRSTFTCIGPTGINFCNKTAVFIGDSFVYGNYASDEDHRWTNIFCAARRATQVNMGVGGTSVQTACIATWDKTTCPTYDPDIHSGLIIALGLNDIGQNKADNSINAGVFKTTYETNLDYIIGTKGWPPSRIVLLNPYKPLSYDTYIGLCSGAITDAADATRAGTYNTAMTEIAADKGCHLIDIYTAMNGLDASYFYTDELHPSDLGYAFIANFLIAAL